MSAPTFVPAARIGTPGTRLIHGAVLAMALLAGTLSGCGRAELWARDRADREFWRARRSLQRIEINPAIASEYDYDRAIEAFDRVVTRFPAQRWARPEGLRDPLTRDVALVSGRAMLAEVSDRSTGANDRASRRRHRASLLATAVGPPDARATVGRRT